MAVSIARPAEARCPARGLPDGMSWDHGPMSLRWSLLFAIACGAVTRPPDPSRRLEVHTAGSVFESDRGYRFAVLPEPNASVVRLDVRYPVGSANDPPGKEGLAHLVE